MGCRLKSFDTDVTTVDSKIPNFRELNPADRLAAVCSAAQLGKNELQALSGESSLPISLANGMIENVIGKFELPLGVAANFKINGKDYLIPMAVEEPSIIAAASYMAKIARQCDGFTTSSSSPVMRAQIQLIKVADPFGTRQKLFQAKEEIINLANSKDQVLLELGGGCKDIEAHVFEESPIGPMVVLHLLVDVRDAMGANTVNTMAELVAPLVEEISGATVRLRILSNLADRRLVRAHVELSPDALTSQQSDGLEVAEGIVEACALALVDPYRAATHNKGIMNGIDPVLVATGNDWRAVEAGAHAYAARNGQYESLSRWEINSKNHLVGTLELPLAVGLVGGATRTHPSAQAAVKLMNVHTASELAEVIAAVGLAQNLAALRALSTEGIQKGHMALHARNIAILAGATGADVDRIASEIISIGEVTVDRATQLLGNK